MPGFWNMNGGGGGGGTGSPGLPGKAATVDVGTTTTGAPGTAALVANVGTTSAAVFDFTIPAGADGKDGKDGKDGTNGKDGAIGKSLYEIDVDNGFEGTELEWLEEKIHPATAIVFEARLARDDVALPKDVKTPIPLVLTKGVGTITADTLYYKIPTTGWWFFRGLMGLTNPLLAGQECVVYIEKKVFTSESTMPVIQPNGFAGALRTINPVTRLLYCEAGDEIGMFIRPLTVSNTFRAWATEPVNVFSGFLISGTHFTVENLKFLQDFVKEPPYVNITVVEDTPDSYVLGIETKDNFFETPNLRPDMRVPTTIRAYTPGGILVNQPLSIQATGSGVQKTTLNADGEYHNYLRTATEYTFKVMQKNRDDLIFPLPHKVITGTLDIPLEVDIPVMYTHKYANPWDWEEIKETVKKNKGISVTKTVTTFGSLSSSTSKWLGGCLAEDGMIYGVPFNASSILCIDPGTKTTTTFGSLSSDVGKWGGGCLAEDGMIYCIPYGATSILCIDPLTKTTTTFGIVNGANKTAGGCLAADGMIYCTPYNATYILCIDPVTKTTTTFGSLSSGASKWGGGCLAEDGMIYCIPCNATSILCIDPVTKTTTTFGTFSGANKYLSGCLAADGMIYCTPFSATYILCIDPVTKTTTTFGSLSSDVGKWRGGCLAVDGMIYCIPYSATYILCIDPVTKTTTTFGSLSSDGNKWIQGYLADDGMMYGIPHLANNVLCIDISANSLSQFSPVALRSSWLNNF